MVDLHEPAIEDAVLSPRAGVVLYAAHLDKWHVPTFGNMNDTVAVRVPGECCWSPAR